MRPTILSLLLCLSAVHTFAQDPTANPVGALIQPTTDIILFDAPPNGAFQSMPVARAIVQPGADGSTLIALQPDSKAPSGYSVTGQAMPTASQMMVTNFVDVYQDKTLNRWVEIAPLDSASPPTWALWGEVGLPPQSFTITGMQEN